MTVRKFSKGATYALDQVYDILGLLPSETYHQDDISDYTPFGGNSCGEEITFLKDVTVKITVSVKD